MVCRLGPFYHKIHFILVKIFINLDRYIEFSFSFYFFALTQDCVNAKISTNKHTMKILFATPKAAAEEKKLVPQQNFDDS